MTYKTQIIYALLFATLSAPLFGMHYVEDLLVVHPCSHSEEPVAEQSTHAHYKLPESAYQQLHPAYLEELSTSRIQFAVSRSAFTPVLFCIGSCFAWSADDDDVNTEFEIESKSS